MAGEWRWSCRAGWRWGRIGERREGEAPVKASRFMVEVLGTKAVQEEEPPRILHFNPRISGDFSGRPVVELNICYRMQWVQPQRCESWASRPDEENVDGKLKCEKWIRDDDSESEDSKMKWWLNRSACTRRLLQLHLEAASLPVMRVAKRSYSSSHHAQNDASTRTHSADNGVPEPATGLFSPSCEPLPPACLKYAMDATRDAGLLLAYPP